MVSTHGDLNLFVQPINNYFLFTGILITGTGISDKNLTVTGILGKCQLENGIETPLQDPPIGRGRGGEQLAPGLQPTRASQFEIWPKIQ